MKKVRDLLWIMVMGILAMFSSCSDDKNDEKTETSEPKMLTFGFYAEDNEGVLATDYVATNVVTAGIKIAMPAFVDKSHLVARFTTNEGNVVLLDGITQVSGATINDFTAPLDYIVSSGKLNVKYTVTIVKASNMGWTKIPDFNTKTVYSGMAMKVNPVEDIPYLAFKIRENENNKMAVVKLLNGSWQPVGSLDGFSEVVMSSDYDLDFGKTGTPYVVYSDDAATVGGAASLMKWNGTSWGYVGDRGLVAAQSQKIQLAVMDNDEVMIAQINNSKKVSFVRNALVISAYKSGWSSAELPLLASGSEVYLCSMSKTSKAAYLTVINRGMVDGVNYGHSVYKYENGQWLALLTNYLEPSATQTSIVCLDIAATNDGTVYLLTADDALIKGSYQLRIKKYNPVDKKWSTVGGAPLDIIINKYINAKVAVAPDGTPFVTYRDDTDQKVAKVVYLDNETKQWSTPFKLDGEVNSDLNISFSSTGIGYISYTNVENHVVTYKYDVLN